MIVLFTINLLFSVEIFADYQQPAVAGHQGESPSSRHHLSPSGHRTRSIAHLCQLQHDHGRRGTEKINISGSINVNVVHNYLKEFSALYNIITI